MKDYSSFVNSESSTKLTYLHTDGAINVWLNCLCYMQGSSELCHIKKWSDLIIIFLRSRYHEKANCNLLMTFWSEWARLKYTLNLVRCFLLHSTKFQYFFYGFKSQLSNSYDNWYVQKYLKGIFHKRMLLIWKEYFTRVILSFSSPRRAIIARLNAIYTKFMRAMITLLNKIWRVWACARATARHSWPGLLRSLF